jgi:hypothetical protein
MIPIINFTGPLSDYALQLLEGKSLEDIASSTNMREEEIEKSLNDMLKVLKKISNSLSLLGPKADILVQTFKALTNKFMKQMENATHYEDASDEDEY